MIKSLHIATVIISLSLFIGRGVWIYGFKNQLTARWIKIIPHANDTILLLTGITLAIQIHQYPFVDNWLTVKIICLLIYIALGFSAMKINKDNVKGLLSWLGAIVIFIFMLSVAINHHPAGIFHYLLL